MEFKDIKIKVEQENKIKEKAPDKMPINPTAQGWTGSQVRKRLASSLIDDDGSLLSELKSKMLVIHNFITQIYNRKIIGIDLLNDIALSDFKNALGNATSSGSGLMSATDKEAFNLVLASVANLETNYVPRATKIIGIDLVNDITLSEFKVALGEATSILNGLMSANDKANLDKAVIDIATLQGAKVDKITTIIGLDLANNILLGEFKTALGNATTSLSGLMSDIDKNRLDALHALLGVTADADTVVNTINEVLMIFQTYPEGATLVDALAGKVDKTTGKGLSTNDLTDILKNNYDSAHTHANVTNANPHNTSYADLANKPITIAGAGILDVYDKTFVDSLLLSAGWEQSLLTPTPLVTTGFILTSTLLENDEIVIIAQNTVTKEIDTDIIPKIFLNTGDKVNLFDNVGIFFEIGVTNSTFTTNDTNVVLSIVGKKIKPVLASQIVVEGTTSVQDKINGYDISKEEQDEKLFSNLKKIQKVEATLRKQINNEALGNVEGEELISLPKDVAKGSPLRFELQGKTEGVNKVAYVNKTIDEVVHEGLSLKDIFEVNNLIPQPTSTSPVISVAPDSPAWALSIITGVNLSLHLSNNFYFAGVTRADVLTGSPELTRFEFWSPQKTPSVSRVNFSNTNGLNNNFSFVFDTLATVQSSPWLVLYQYWTAPATFTATISWENMHLISMNTFTVQPTQAQMDTWRDMYLARKGITKQHLTYADIFEVNNMITNSSFDVDTTGWLGGFGTLSVANGVAELVADGTQPWPQIQQDFNLPVISGEKLYISSRFNIVTGGKLAVHLRTPGMEGVIEQTFPLNTWSDFSQIHTVLNSNATSLLVFINAFPTAAEANGAVSKYDDVFMIRMSNFDELATKEILDSLRAQYLKYKAWSFNGVTFNKRLTSKNNILFDGLLQQGNIDYITGAFNPEPFNFDYYNINGIEVLPNTLYFAKDFNDAGFAVFVEYDKNYAFIKSTTGQLSVLTSATTKYLHFVFNSLIDMKIMVTKDIAPTLYIPYEETQVFVSTNAEGHLLPNEVKDTIEYRSGKYFHIQRAKKHTFISSDIISVTNESETTYARTRDFSDGHIGISSVIIEKTIGTNHPRNDINRINEWTASGHHFEFIFALNTTLAEARTALVGRTLVYQLVTPIETEIPTSGMLLGHGDGEIKIENVIQNIDVYTTQIDITDINFPIVGLEKVEILKDDGTTEKLNVADCVINANKLSFTHPTLVAGDIVYFTYFHLGMFGNSVIVYMDNKFVVQDSVTNEWKKWGIELNNGVFSIVGKDV